MLEVICRSYLSLAVLAAAIGIPACAATVDYTTTASFSCTPGTCVITGNNTDNVSIVYGTGADTATLIFAGSPSGTSVNSDPEFTAASYGIITASYSGNGANINGTFQLMLQQTAPNMSPTTGTLGIATLSGLVFDGKSMSYANFGVSDPPSYPLCLKTAASCMAFLLDITYTTALPSYSSYSMFPMT